MKKTDTFLAGIAAGLLVLVVVAFAVVAGRPEPSYQTGETPEDIVHNYLLALQLEDFERAYGFLSPSLVSYPPTVETFFDELERDSWRFQSTDSASLSVQSSRLIGDRAVVEVRETLFFGGGLFESNQRFELFELELTRIDGAWKISGGDYYFARCWTFIEGCPFR